jgi:hypothetical protein
LTHSPSLPKAPSNGGAEDTTILDGGQGKGSLGQGDDVSNRYSHTEQQQTVIIAPTVVPEIDDAPAWLLYYYRTVVVAAYLLVLYKELYTT